MLFAWNVLRFKVGVFSNFCANNCVAKNRFLLTVSFAAAFHDFYYTLCYIIHLICSPFTNFHNVSTSSKKISFWISRPAATVVDNYETRAMHLAGTDSEVRDFENMREV